ncbi:hypothetical protein ACSQ76_13970 [Roseovarius sp. B08]|uniref:hypothetical protein n=1 Tax=Roseovarius sp. B08 TaxID=3449223 RepID=UPI003EDC3982
MRRFTSAIAAVFCFGLATPGSAEGDPKPGLLDLITVDRIAESLASVAISALRTQMEVEYEHLQTDILRGTVALTGVTLRPQLPHDRARQCEITVQRISVDLGQPAAAFGVATISSTMVGANAAIACVPRDVGLGLRSAGYNAIEVDRLTYEAEYVHSTGEIRVNGSAAVNELAILDLAAAGAVLPRLDQFGLPGDPAVRVRRAVVGLQDQGGWERLSSLIPENLRQPEVIQSLGTEELTNMLSNNGTRALTATERRFIDDLMNHVADFVRDPGEITIEAQLPASGIVLEPEIYERPEELLQALAPDARTASIARANLMGADTLGRLDEGDVSAAERLDIAKALLQGDGVPRTEALVPDILAPLLVEGGAEAPEAALLTAQAQAATDPDAAYQNTLTAAAGRQPGAIAMLDRLEERLATTQVLAAQDAHIEMQPSAPALPAGDDIRAVRSQALAYFTGLGAPRSYRQAYYFALIAEAAGDIGARPLREDIENRFANRGLDVSATWQALRTEVQTRALTDWIESDLADRYSAAD